MIATRTRPTEPNSPQAFDSQIRITFPQPYRVDGDPVQLRLIGTLDDARIVNDATGEELEGVRSVKLRADREKMWRAVEITLDHVAIDLAFDESRVEVNSFEDTKYAHSKLGDVARLLWRK